MKSAKAKEEVRKMLEGLPDDASLEDIQYHSTGVRDDFRNGLDVATILNGGTVL